MKYEYLAVCPQCGESFEPGTRHKWTFEITRLRRWCLEHEQECLGGVDDE